jgi:hypothetical protein
LAMADASERACPKCGYLMGPFDESCPRCDRFERTPCSVCGRTPSAAECSRCHQAVCEACSARDSSGALVCRNCGAPARVVGEGAPAHPVTRAPLGGGFGASVSRGLIFIRESVAMAFRDKDLLLPSFFCVFAMVGYVGVVLAIAAAAGVRSTQAKDDSAAEWIIFAILALGLYVITYFFAGMTINLVATHIRGRDARLGEAFADAWKNVFALAALAVVSTVVGLLTSRARRGGRAGEIVGGIVDRVWTVLTYLILPAIVLEDLSLTQAAGRARQLHAGGLLGIAVGEIGVVLISKVIGFVGAILAVGLGLGLFLATPLGPIIAIAAGALVLTFVVAFTSYIRTAYYTCLFLWAAETETAGEQAVVPRPIAAALG